MNFRIGDIKCYYNFFYATINSFMRRTTSLIDGATRLLMDIDEVTDTYRTLVSIIRL